MTTRNKMISRMIIFSLFVGALSLSAFATSSTIALRLSSDGGSTWTPTVYDTDSDGLVTFLGTVGGWSANITSGIGTPNNPAGEMNVSSSNDTGSSFPGTLVIEFSEINVSPAFNSWDMDFGGTLNNATASYEAWYSNSNLFFATGSQIGTTMGAFFPPDFSQNNFGLSTPGTVASFSLTQILTIVPTNDPLFHGDFHAFSGGADLVPAPEPASLMLMGAGLLGLGVIRRRLGK